MCSSWVVAVAVFEHHGNGEHPQLRARRRQLLLWRSLGLLIVVGEVLGLVRLVRDLLADSPPGSVVYQAAWLAVNGLLGVLVVVRVRFLARR